VGNLYTLSCSFFLEDFLTIVECGLLWLAKVGDVNIVLMIGIKDALESGREHAGAVPGYREGVRPHEVIVCAEKLDSLRINSPIRVNLSSGSLWVPSLAPNNI
jgi:hypothetical protein